MPSRSFQKDAFNNESKIKNYKKSTSKRYSNGKLVSPESSESKIQGAGEIFKKNGMVGAGETTADSIPYILNAFLLNQTS